MDTSAAPAAAEAPAASWDRRWRYFFVCVLVVYLGLAYSYVWTMQPRYGPDEPRHLAYIKRLVDKGKLPYLINGREIDGHHIEVDGAHTHQPPLYYVLMAPVYLVTRGSGDLATYMVAKHLSPLLLLGALLFYLALLRRVFPHRPFAAAAAFTVVALLPEYQLIASVMNNDTLTVLLGAVFFWLLVRAWDEPASVRWSVIVGLVLAAFVNSKANGWTLAPLWALAILLRARRFGGPPALWWRDLLIAYGLLFLLGTGWYIRNYILYGYPVVFEFMEGTLHPRHPRTGEILTPIEVYLSGEIIPMGVRATVGLFQSFWSQIDWIKESYRPAIYLSLLVLVLAAATGLAVRLRARWQGVRSTVADGRSAFWRFLSTPVILLGLGFALTYLSTWYIAACVHLGFYQGGRYLLPSVFGAGVLLALGWETLVPRRFQFGAAVALLLVFVALNVLCLVELITYLNPRYVTPWPG